MASVFITGGAGFVGLNVTEALLARGDTVVIYGREALPAPAAAAFAALPGRLSVMLGDVLDDDALRAAVRAQPIDAVLPFAAITAGPAREAESPEQVLDVNLKGLVATLKAVRDHGRDHGGVRRVVLPSSSAVYGESAYAHPVLTEAATPCVPISLYGVTKYAAERMGLRLCGLWGLDAIAARIGATFGPWERDTGLRDTLSPHLSIAQAAVAGRAAILPPGPLPAYDWIYVRDLAAGIVALIDAPPPEARVFNLSSGRDWSPEIGACCDAMAARFPGFFWRHADAGEEATIGFNETRPRGVMANARAASLGWAPRFSPTGAYADYAAWAAAHPGAI